METASEQSLSTIEELRKAKEMAELASEAKSQLLAIMSHETRTHLNVVPGMSELLKDTVLTMQQLEYLRAIEVSGETLLQLLNDFLDVSKIEAGERQLNEGIINTKLLIEKVLTLSKSKKTDPIS